MIIPKATSVQSEECSALDGRAAVDAPHISHECAGQIAKRVGEETCQNIYEHG
jgi:hypothetical protein